MKNLKSLLLLTILSLSLISCSSDTTSTSSSTIEGWDSDSLSVMETYLNGYTIPFYSQLFESTVTVDSSSSETTETNYSVYYNSLTSMVVVTYVTDYIEDVDSYYEFICEEYADEYTTDEELTDTTNSDYYVYQVVSSTSSIDSRFYLNIYYDDLSLCLTIDAYIQTIYTYTSWPTDENDLVISDYLGLTRDYVSYFTFEPLGMTYMTLQQAFSFTTGLPTVEIEIFTTSQSSLDDFIDQLTSKDYIYDSDNDTESQYNYYQIIYYDEDTALFSFECYIDNEITTLTSGYSYQLTFTYNY